MLCFRTLRVADASGTARLLVLDRYRRQGGAANLVYLFSV